MFAFKHEKKKNNNNDNRINIYFAQIQKTIAKRLDRIEKEWQRERKKKKDAEIKRRSR